MKKIIEEVKDSEIIEEVESTPISLRECTCGEMIDINNLMEGEVIECLCGVRHAK
jgi:hypothetical protein